MNTSDFRVRGLGISSKMILNVIGIGDFETYMVLVVMVFFEVYIHCNNFALLNQSVLFLL